MKSPCWIRCTTIPLSLDKNFTERAKTFKLWRQFSFSLLDVSNAGSNHLKPRHRSQCHLIIAAYSFPFLDFCHLYSFSDFHIIAHAKSSQVIIFCQKFPLKCPFQ